MSAPCSFRWCQYLSRSLSNVFEQLIVGVCNVDRADSILIKTIKIYKSEGNSTSM
jgi:hypothetical protein